MIDVTVTKHIHSIERAPVIIERRYQMPFAPFVGLVILEGSEEMKVESVEYDAETRTVSAQTASHKRLLDPDNRDFGLERLVGMYVDNGWVRRCDGG